MSQDRNIQNSEPSTSSNVHPYVPQINMPSTSSNMNPNAPQVTALNMNAPNVNALSNYVHSTQIQKVPQVNMTFAQALKHSSIPPEAIRNLSFMGTPEHVTLTIDRIKADQTILDMGLIAIIRKSDDNYTVKCPDKDIAELFHDHITRSYSRDSVICSTVVVRRPPVKISGAGISIDENEDASVMKEGILVQILHQKKWMAPLTDIEIDQIYTVQSPRMKYTNIILSAGMKTQEMLLKKGNIILGFGQCRVTEYIDLIQCQKCNRFGHLRRTCNFECNCRKCGQAHDKDTCNVVNAIPNCHNCLIANQQGANYNLRHNVTDDRCPIKKQRINALKIQLLQKN